MTRQCPQLLRPQPQGGSKSNDLSSGCWEPTPGFWPHHPTGRRSHRGSGSLVGLSFPLCREGEGRWGRWAWWWQLWAAWWPPPTLQQEAREPTAAPGAWKWRLSKIWGLHRDWPRCHQRLQAGPLGKWVTQPLSEAEENREQPTHPVPGTSKEDTSGAQVSKLRPPLPPSPRPLPAEPRASGNQVGHRRLIPTSREKCHGNLPSKHSAITKAAQKALLSSFSKHSSSKIGHFFVMGEGGQSSREDADNISRASHPSPRRFPECAAFGGSLGEPLGVRTPPRTRAAAKNDGKGRLTSFQLGSAVSL